MLGMGFLSQCSLTLQDYDFTLYLINSLKKRLFIEHSPCVRHCYFGIGDIGDTNKDPIFMDLMYPALRDSIVKKFEKMVSEVHDGIQKKNSIKRDQEYM